MVLHCLKSFCRNLTIEKCALNNTALRLAIDAAPVILSSQVVSLPFQSVILANFCAAMDTLIDQDEQLYAWREKRADWRSRDFFCGPHFADLEKVYKLKYITSETGFTIIMFG